MRNEVRSKANRETEKWRARRLIPKEITKAYKGTELYPAVSFPNLGVVQTARGDGQGAVRDAQCVLHRETASCAFDIGRRGGGDT